ncbi:MAG TPA: thiamine pyrophosphate-dependent enzyme [Chloroflexota bacterium]|jgi:hypothetical protein
MGDGGMLMSLGELDAPVRHGVPLLILVMNDSARSSGPAPGSSACWPTSAAARAHG